MADLSIDRAQLEIVIKNDESRKRIRELEEDTNRLTKEMKSLEKQGKKDTAEWKDKEQALKRNRAEMDRIVKQIGLTGLTMKELSQRQRELNAIMRNMDPRLPEYKKLQVQLDAVSGRMSELKGKSQAAAFSLNKIADGFNKYFGMITAFAATFTGVILGFRKIIDIANKFGESVANLSALTGLAGEELQWLSDQAKNVAKNGTDAGIKVTAGAQAIVDAYTLMGSAKPELLKNKEALDEVTQAALIMADAAKITATEAVDSLANTMNQFGAPASEASKYINVLAAGSKEGAAAIPLISASMVKFGAAASAANISVEESVGLIETLAEKGLKGELAGTQIKTALLKMQTGADDTNPKIVGLQKALENLRNKNLSAADMMKFFGLESYVAAQILVSTSDRVKYFTDAVTGTNVALEQATVNTETNAAALKRAQNNFELTAITLGEKLAPALTFSTNSFNYLVKAILGAPEFFRKNEIAIIAMLGALFALNAARLKFIATSTLEYLTLQKGIGLRIKDAVVMQTLIVKEELLTIWKTKGTIASKLATTAQYAWNTAIKANPIGAIILAITALVAAVKLWDKNNADAIARQRELNMVLSYSEEILQGLKKVREEQKSQIERLNQLSVTEKQDLREKIRLSIEYAKAKLLELQAKEANLQKDNTQTTLWQTLTNSILSFGNATAFTTNQIIDAALNGAEATAPIREQIKEFDSQLKQFEETAIGLDEVLKAESIADKIGIGSIAELEEKIKYLGVALRNVAIDSEDYTRISGKLSTANTQLKTATKELSDANDDASDKTKKLATAYEKLSKALSDAKNKITDLIAAGKFADAKTTGNLVSQLEMQKHVIDRIAGAGGDVNKFLEDLTNSDDNLLAEQEEFWSNFLTDDKNKEAYAKYLESQKQAQEQQTQTDINKVETPLQLDEEKPKFDKDFYLNSIQVASDAAFDIYAASQDARFNREMSLLNKQMEAELSNKNLTEEQKDKIRAKYAAKEAKLKQEQFKRQKIADIIQAIINTAMAVVKALPNAPLAVAAGIAGAAQIAVIASQPIPQFYAGKYPVTGADDGRTYQAEWTGTPTTGLYSRPSLIAERGPEIVIDAPTTSRMRANAPELIHAIYRMAGKIPQRAEGKYPGDVLLSGANAAIQRTDESSALLATAINMLMEKEFRAKIVYNEYEDMKAKVESIESESTF